MKKRQRAVLVALALVGVAGCAPAKDVFGDPKAGYVGDVAARVAAADWSSAETLTIALSEFAFSPDRLTFQEGAPYRLSIENGGERAHSFVSEGFFEAIAARKLTTPSGAVEHLYLKSIAFSPGEAKELHFVAVKPGTYELECTVPLHATFGMTGKIRIEREALATR